MRALVSAVLLASAIGVAFAQETPRVFTPRWEAEPSGADYARLYPRAALNQNVSGVAVLCCTPRADRSLECSVGHEWPAGQGFGAASLQAAQRFRLTLPSYDDYKLNSDTQIRLGMLWAAAVVSQETRDRLASIDRETGFICADLTFEARQN